jgi:hypothetical protein
MAHNGHGILKEDIEAAADGLEVVIGTTLVAAREAMLKGFLLAVEEEDEGAVIAGGALPGVAVLLIAGKPINEEAIGAAVRLLAAALHGREEEVDGDVGGNNLPFAKGVCNVVALLGATAHVLAQKLTSGEMLEVEITYERL